MVMRLVIPRDRWQRGTSDGTLWDEKTDCGCILGHYGLALGYNKFDLTGCSTPSEVVIPTDTDTPLWPEWIMHPYGDDEDDDPIYVDASIVNTIIGTNDRQMPSGDDDRELSLKNIFARHGVELEFV